MKIYFHVGQAKTGSGAIQSFLNINREILATRYKILYPNINSTDIGKGILHILGFLDIPLNKVPLNSLFPVPQRRREHAARALILIILSFHRSCFPGIR